MALATTNQPLPAPKRLVTTFTPPPTIRKFMLDDSFARFVLGPLGSGKTTGMALELIRRARQQEPDRRGIRPTRFAVIRNTLQQLKQTVLPDVRQLLGPMADWKVSESLLSVRATLPDRTRVESEWLFVPVDTVEDTRRLLSLQLTGAWVSEFREVPFQTIAAMMGRLGRYPRAFGATPTWSGLIGESNPFSEGSDWHEALELNRPAAWALFRQPGGLDPEAENREHLPANYYENLLEGHDEDWINVHVHAQYGDDLGGQPVFRRSFVPKVHVSETTLTVDTRRPLMVMQDLGRTPTSLIGQIDSTGRLVVFAEVLSTDCALWQFCGEMLLPELRGARFSGNQAFVVMDPAGLTKSQLREENAADIFKAHGLVCYGASTNDIQTRLNAVEGLLMSMRAGKPAIIIDGQNCPNLVMAMQHKYRYRRRKDGDVEDTPEKTHPWSDLADCLQYGALSVQLDLTGRHVRRSMVVPRRTPFGAAAWT